MSKLKTLKEITWDLMQDTKLRHPARIELQLRQEVIKDIENPELLSLMADLDFEVEIKAVMKYIKWKFNITSKDLK